MSRLQACVRAGALALLVCVVAGQWPAFGQPSGDAPATTAAQDEFVPISELPPEDRLPAAPFLVGAYTMTLVLLAGYVWLLWRRVGTLQRELHDVRQATRRGGAPM